MTILFYDLETTGINPKKDRPVSVGLINHASVSLIDTLCNPGISIPKEASVIHGIYDNDVENFASAEVVLDALVSFFESWPFTIISGYNITMYDNIIVESVLQRKVFENRIVLDVFDLICRYFPKLPSKALGNVYKSMFGKELVGAHGALADCFATAEILSAIVNYTNKEAFELAAELEKPIVYKTFPIGKYRGRPSLEVPKSWAQWAKDNFDNMRPDLELTINAILES